MSTVAHCPRCKADVTVTEHGRCAYCSRRLGAHEAELAQPAPAEPWPLCRECGREPRRHTVGPYAGLCGTCVIKKRDQMTAKRRATVAQNKAERLARVAPPSNGGGMPEQPDQPAETPATNGVLDAGPVERKAWELVAAARRVDQAEAAWATLAIARERVQAARDELDSARTAYQVLASNLDRESETASA